MEANSTIARALLQFFKPYLRVLPRLSNLSQLFRRGMLTTF
jgi:hypothetical protein